MNPREPVAQTCECGHPLEDHHDSFSGDLDVCSHRDCPCGVRLKYEETDGPGDEPMCTHCKHPVADHVFSASWRAFTCQCGCVSYDPEVAS